MARFTPVVVDHFTNPRNAGELDAPDARAFIGNPVCGDQIMLTAHVADGTVTEARFRAHGCAASLATASVITEAATGRPLDELAGWNAEHVEELLGGLPPAQRHVAALGADVARRLVTNYQEGTNDDIALSCA
ncbi:MULTISPECIES: iron-sulfur cluster assembly scaffold protein [Streptomyces]|uniref:Similarity with Nitrogen-fixing NifU-like proteins n=1 Tax=Streptomyces spororaveus TaxID=284039 RepID=A0ABQ3T5E9_9ACTN|nr:MULTISPECIES: iron-sulfur cluster assembly scaffold protein [Streptomyces]MCM9076579.1 iron-sulfur cluster assembly scaffold protein [Streptomyces spororaveus]MCX5308763.1 iron-sulfur cluster assembly scaffold protein [Streptomyces sp. NBC_00160]GHI75623.1 similarity with Nitrogen-fixing NifU-like proteins [Streptomyces spororaveus]